MIIGIGNDIVNIDRIKNSIDKFGDRFIDRIFTHEERLKADASALRAAAYAKRFAAKEAAWKALGDGQRLGIKWTELSVLNAKSGKPILYLTGKAAEILNNLMPLGMVPRLDLSLSDEPPVAQAFVVISAELSEHATLRK
jgi:holo-[acyl-carrier protein] synthase